MKLTTFLINHGVNSIFYLNRTNIKETFQHKSNLLWGLTEFDCRYNANNLLELLLKDDPSIWEYNTCNTKAKQTIVPRIFFQFTIPIIFVFLILYRNN